MNEHHNWAVQMQARMAETLQRHPCPAGVSLGFWLMLSTYAAQQNGLARLCLEQGKAWTGEHRPTVPRGPRKQCFRNAAELAYSRPGQLTYVEGFGCTEKVGMALHHAWVVDQDGQVLDPTWDDGASYCGLGIRTDALLEITSKSKLWGVFGEFTPEWVAADQNRWLAPVRGLPTSRPG